MTANKGANRLICPFIKFRYSLKLVHYSPGYKPA